MRVSVYISIRLARIYSFKYACTIINRMFMCMMVIFMYNVQIVCVCVLDNISLVFFYSLLFMNIIKFSFPDFISVGLWIWSLLLLLLIFSIILFISIQIAFQNFLFLFDVRFGIFCSCCAFYSVNFAFSTVFWCHTIVNMKLPQIYIRSETMCQANCECALKRRWVSEISTRM